MKTCTKCKIEKQISEFTKGRCHCRECRHMYRAAYYSANKEKASALAAVYHANNKEKQNSRSKNWHYANLEKARQSSLNWAAKNKDKKKAITAAWAAANKERVKEVGAAWLAANPEIRRMYKRNRRARILAVGGKLSLDLKEKLFTLQRGKCACGCKQMLGTDYHLDHIMPLALGGSNTDDNIQLLRARCNRKKNAKHPVDYMQSKGFLI